jgi:hypothetical protein
MYNLGEKPEYLLLLYLGVDLGRQIRSQSELTRCNVLPVLSTLGG